MPFSLAMIRRHIEYCYVSMLIALIFCMAVTLRASTDIREPHQFWSYCSIVQFIDNNIIMPEVVGSKVKLNACSDILRRDGSLCKACISGMFPLHTAIVAHSEDHR